MYRYRVFAFAALLLSAASFLTQAEAGAVKKKVFHHKHLHHALYELHDARHELLATKHDFGAHKAKAVTAINDAIKQVELALIAHGDTLSVSPTKRDLREHHKHYLHHPHLHHALVELRHAHKEMHNSSHDFGGHKKAALRDINHAIHEIHALLNAYKKI